MRSLAVLALIPALAVITVAPSEAGLRAETVTYQEGGETLEGYLAWDDAFPARRPGVLVVHEWWGLNDYARTRAAGLVDLGYVAFAADIYGRGKRADDAREAGHLAGVYLKDRERLRSRALAALEVLKKNPHVDPKRVAAIGFCFGGTTVLELARADADLLGVVSFHGGLKTPRPEATGGFEPKVLVLHGSQDPFVPMADVLAFREEMDRANADWHLVVFGGAKHSFSVPEADGSLEGAVYDETAARRSWQHMQTFFRELFETEAR